MKYEKTKEAKQEGLVYLIGSILLLILMFVIILGGVDTIELKTMSDRMENNNHSYSDQL